MAFDRWILGWSKWGHHWRRYQSLLWFFLQRHLFALKQRKKGIYKCSSCDADLLIIPWDMKREPRQIFVLRTRSQPRALLKEFVTMEYQTITQLEGKSISLLNNNFREWNLISLILSYLFCIVFLQPFASKKKKWYTGPDVYKWLGGDLGAFQKVTTTRFANFTKYAHRLLRKRHHSPH